METTDAPQSTWEGTIRKAHERWARAELSHAGEAAFKLLALFNSQECPYRFLEMTERGCSSAKFWTGLHHVWSVFDAIPHARYAQMFRKHGRKWNVAFMSEAQQAIYKGLPDRVTVYRGQNADAPIGLSWTLDRAVAEGFARGHRGAVRSAPVIIQASVHKSDIASVQWERQEQEIVVFRPECADRKQFEPLAT